MHAVLSTMLLFSGLALLLGFAGQFHGIGDTLAVLRPPLVLILAGLSVLAFLARLRRLGAIGLLASIAAATSMLPTAPPSLVPEDARTYTAYQKNLLFLLPDTRPVATDILSTNADFVTLQELHSRNRPILGQLSADYPHQLLCPFAIVGGTAVLSRWPAVKGRTICSEGRGLAAMQVETPDGPLWIVSLHLHWPYPYRQPEQLNVLLPILKGLETPVMVGGDFNMVPWSFAVRSIARTTDTRLSGYPGGTFALSYLNGGGNLLGWVPELPIDHILVPEAGEALKPQRRAKHGSDHNGLITKFTLTRPQ